VSAAGARMPAPTRRAVVLGIGGLGCPASLALLEAARQRALGLQLVLVDDDVVERSNLSRQILFREADVGRPKVEAAKEALRALAGASEASIEIACLRLRFTAESAPEILRGASMLLDGTDDFPTRFLANDAARAAGVPLVHGAVLGWIGQLLTVVPGGGGCLRCFFEGPPPVGAVPACAEAGVASPLCGLVGAAMAGEAVRLLRDEPPRAASRLLRWNGLAGTLRESQVRRDPACPACAAPPARASSLFATQRSL
jgi:molybdopterin/thiamine biosynthesis adenylyltransferase